MSHWIITPVLLPALLGALIVLLGRRDADTPPRLARRLAALGSAALILLALALLHHATATGPEVYRLGNWPAPFGITLVLDRLSALMLVLTAVLAGIALWQAMATGWDRRGAHFHALWMFQLMGLNGAFLTGDAFNLFVFFEVMLIASYGLLVHGGGAERLRAGMQYVAVNLVGSTLFLFALATIYAVTGTLNMADLGIKMAQLPEGDFALIRVAAVLLLLVFALKGALVPLQFWLPGSYVQAPGVVAALFAVMTKVGAYAAIRTGTLIFPTSAPAIGPLLSDLLLPAALITLLVGAVGVLGARSLPRQAAFLVLSSMGLTFTAIAGFTAPGLSAALYYILHSTFAGALMFLIADLVQARSGRLDGTGPRLPGALAVAFLAAAIAGAGLPPLSGFLGKLFILQASPSPLVWSVVLIGAFLMILGLARSGSALFWKAEGTVAALPARQLVAPALLVLLLIALTLAAGPVSDWTRSTANTLTDPGYPAALGALGAGGTP